MNLPKRHQCEVVGTGLKEHIANVVKVGNYLNNLSVKMSTTTIYVFANEGFETFLKATGVRKLSFD